MARPFFATPAQKCLLIFLCYFVNMAACYDCSAGSHFFPADLSMSKERRYPFIESYAQLFRDLTINCDDAFITEWHFLSSTPFIYGLHLAVFRPENVQTRQFNSTVYLLINETYINNHNIGHSVMNWVDYVISSPIRVQKGDIIGLFYDRFDAPRNKVAIRSAMRWASNANTLVFNTDQVGIGPGKMITGQGTLVNRVPALYVTLDYSPKSSAQRMPQSFNSIIQRSGNRPSPSITDGLFSRFDELQQMMMKPMINLYEYKRLQPYKPGMTTKFFKQFFRNERGFVTKVNSFPVHRAVEAEQQDYPWYTTTTEIRPVRPFPKSFSHITRCQFIREGSVSCETSELLYVVAYDAEAGTCREIAMCSASPILINMQERFNSQEDWQCRHVCKRGVSTTASPYYPSFRGMVEQRRGQPFDYSFN